MSLRINNNIASINGHRNMLKNDMAISKSLEKLSSGLRINKAADDAAGLVISEQMRAQITGIEQAIDNTETAIAMVQTAEGALDEMNSLLNKARELALHAANEGANDQNQLDADQAELNAIVDSITRIGDTTQFGNKKILDGSLAKTSSVTLSNNTTGGDVTSVVSTLSSVEYLEAGNYTFELEQAGAAAATTQADSYDLAFAGGALTNNIGTGAGVAAASLLGTTDMEAGDYAFQLQKDGSVVYAGTYNATVTADATGGSAKDLSGSINLANVEDSDNDQVQNAGALDVSDTLASGVNYTMTLFDSSGTAQAIHTASGDDTTTFSAFVQDFDSSAVIQGGANVSAIANSTAATDGAGAGTPGTLAVEFTINDGGDATGYYVRISDSLGNSLTSDTIGAGDQTSNMTFDDLVDAFQTDLAGAVPGATVDTNDAGGATAGLDIEIADTLAEGADSNGYSVQVTNQRTTNQVTSEATSGGTTSEATATVIAMKNNVGQVVERLTSQATDTVANISTVTNNTLGLTIDLDDDFAQALSGNAVGDVVNNGGGALTLTTADDEEGAVFQVGANAFTSTDTGQQASVGIQSMRANDLGNYYDTANNRNYTLQDLKDLSMLSDADGDTTTLAIQVIDAAIDEVTTTRGDLGAFQANTLETNVSSLRVTMENMTAAESTIRDVDFAAESARFTRNNIMIQASTAMLAQANQLPQNVLQLLG